MTDRQINCPAVPSHESKLSSDSGAYRFKQGDFDVTVVSDGFITVPIEIVSPGGSQEERDEILRATGDIETGLVKPGANIPIIQNGDDVIIVDVGSGDKYQPSDGKLSANLQIAGIAATAITKVVLTHGHPDHIWGMLDSDGSLRFANASYYAGEKEWDFWMNQDYLNVMPAELHEFARGARRDLAAIRDRVVMLKPGDDIVTGLRAIDTPGHTPGHLSLEMSGGEGLIIAVDAVTNEIASFQHPTARFGYDTVPDLAIETRARLIDRAAKDRTKLLGYHWTYPGVGFAVRNGSNYRYLAV